MARKKIPFSLLSNVEIGPAVAEGNCIARVDNKVVFVKFAAPGDVADLQITGKKKKFLEAKILQLHHASDKRTEPFCRHFGTCGGCKWQHLNYSEQLTFKQQQVVDALQRIGGLQDFEIMPIAGAADIKGYRNKLDMTFSNQAWKVNFDPEHRESSNALGFHIPGRFDKVLDLEECHLMPEEVNAMHRSIKQFCEANNYSFFDLNEQHGLMRNVLFRCNSKGEWMVLVSFHENNEAEIAALLNHIRSSFPQIVSLCYVINPKRNDTLADLEVQVWHGDPWLTETLGSLQYKIRPQSFFQTNTKQAERLYNITKEFAGLTGSELVYDLYTGTGSIALYVAANARHVVGVEYVPEAIQDAKENMKANGIENAAFFAGDMKDILTSEFVQIHGRPDVVITDPPRDGMHPDVVRRLLEMEAKRIVYVSCNPATQARDAIILSEKYRLVKIQPVDMFPHTHHVENVGLWELKSNPS